MGHCQGQGPRNNPWSISTKQPSGCHICSHQHPCLTIAKVHQSIFTLLPFFGRQKRSKTHGSSVYEQHQARHYIPTCKFIQDRQVGAAYHFSMEFGILDVQQKMLIFLLFPGFSGSPGVTSQLVAPSRSSPWCIPQEIHSPPHLLILVAMHGIGLDLREESRGSRKPCTYLAIYYGTVLGGPPPSHPNLWYPRNTGTCIYLRIYFTYLFCLNIYWFMCSSTCMFVHMYIST